MIKSKILLSVYSAFVMIFLLQFLHGPRGVDALKELQSYRKLLEGNLRELKMNNGRLRDHFELLKTDSSTVRLAARELGFFQGGEMVLKFTGMAEENPAPLSPGKILLREGEASFQEDFFRLSWTVLFLVFYGILEILTKLVPPLGRMLARGASE